jgi:serine/threonine-protein kinase
MPDLSLPAIGSLVANKYRIEALLDSGGMGAVFVAHHQQLHSQIAIKCLLPELANNGDFRHRFRREARSAFLVRHPHVVSVHDVGVHQGLPFLAMEFLEGESLERILERGVPPLAHALRWLIGSMRGVDAAHRRGIIHRDVKPENIFIVFNAVHPEGHAKMLDFGVSKTTDELLGMSTLTSIGEVIGTPHYMSFEQMSSASEVDVRTDIYSFGVLLYKALTGRLPFDSDNLPGLAVAMATQRPAPPSELRADLPEELDAIVMKAMAFERQHRYAELRELIDALIEFAPRAGLRAEDLVEHTPTIITDEVWSPRFELEDTQKVAVEEARPEIIAPSQSSAPRRGLHVALGLCTVVLVALALARGVALLSSPPRMHAHAHVVRPRASEPSAEEQRTLVETEIAAASVPAAALTPASARTPKAVRDVPLVAAAPPERKPISPELPRKVRVAPKLVAAKPTPAGGAARTPRVAVGQRSGTLRLDSL